MQHNSVSCDTKLKAIFKKTSNKKLKPRGRMLLFIDFSPHRLGNNQKEQFLLWPGALGTTVAACRLDAIARRTLVMTVAALQ